MFDFLRRKPKQPESKSIAAGMPAAHLFLLSRFLTPHGANDFSAPGWAEALGDYPPSIVARFLQAGLIVEGSLSEQLSHRFKVPELKSLLKLRGVPISGTKDTLIARLIETAPKEARKLAGTQPVYICTEKGRLISERYLAAEEAKRAAAEAAALAALARRDFTTACKAVYKFRSQEVFAQGVGITSESPNFSREISRLKIIFRDTPRILRKVSKQHHEVLRQAAAMLLLWGSNRANRWLPEDLDLGVHFNAEVAARMWHFYANHRASLDEYGSNSVVKKVRIRIAGKDSTCPTCQALDGQEFTLGRAPELPHEHCTHAKGCRCLCLPVTK